MESWAGLTIAALGNLRRPQESTPLDFATSHLVAVDRVVSATELPKGAGDELAGTVEMTVRSPQPWARNGNASKSVHYRILPVKFGRPPSYRGLRAITNCELPPGLVAVECFQTGIQDS